VLSNCDTIGAATIAERLLHAVRKDTIVLAEGTVSVTLSAGVATSGIVQDAETLVGAADAALYRAKRSGRNRVEVATAAESKGE
jgi:diguanylate cyclase (GGDEF)-like protein